MSMIEDQRLFYENNTFLPKPSPPKVMQSADPSTLFQSDASIAIGHSRALKASKTSTGSQWGYPIWLGHKHEDVEKLASGGAGADGGPGKVLDVKVDQERQLVWTAESGGSVRGICLETGDCKYLLRGHTAPASCLTVYQTPSGRSILISGSWDKSLRLWPLPISASNQIISTSSDSIRIKHLLFLPNAGSDFIKAVHALDSSSGTSLQALLSGGSDRTVRAWDMKDFSNYVDSIEENSWAKAGNGEEIELPTAPSLTMMATMREHTRPVSALASISLQPKSSFTSSTSIEPLTIFSADSMGRIFEMRLHIDRSEKTPSAKFEMRRELKGNETGVFALSAGWRRKFDEDAEEDENGNVKEEWQAEVWTGSHDNTARLFDLSAKDQKPPQASSTSTSTKYAAVGSQPPLYSIRSIPHSDYVKALLPLSHLFSSFSSQSQDTRLTKATAASSLLPDVLLSGSTDEQLRIWDLASRSSAEELAQEREQASKLRSLNGQTSSSVAESGGAQLIRLVEGHWHEISSIGIWWRTKTGELESERILREEEEKKAGGKKSEEEKNGMNVTQARGNLEGAGEWWIVTSSLDGSVRRWKLSEILIPKPISTVDETKESEKSSPPEKQEPTKGASSSAMTEEEERELAELMDDDE